MKLEFKKNLLLAIFLIIFFIISAIPVRAASVEPDLANILPQYPVNGQTYWIAFKEGFRNNRIELSTCNISGNKEKAYIEWNGSLVLKVANATGRYNQYKLSEKDSWEQIGTYGRFSDWATSIIASNLDVYDSKGKLILAKKNLKNYPESYRKTDINKAKIPTISNKYYTGKSIKPHLKITYNGKYLYERVDYTLCYKNNRKVGTASIVIKGKGDFKGTKTVKFKIIKKPKGSINLSKKSLILSLADVRTHTLKITKKGISSKVKWKSSDTSVADVKNGKITAKGKGKVNISVSANGVTATCKVTVKDTANKTVKMSFKTFDDWIGQVRKKEMELVFGGITGVNTDGSTYYTGNIIVNRQILSYKKVAVKISSNTPGYYKTVYLNLPDKVKYTLHRHNLKNNLNEKGVGRIMAGLVDKQIVWTQECGCGYERVLTWDIPIEKPEKLTDGETYIVYTNSLVI